MRRQELREERDEERGELGIRDARDQAEPPASRTARARRPGNGRLDVGGTMPQQRTDAEHDQERGADPAQHVERDLGREDQRRHAHCREQTPEHDAATVPEHRVHRRPTAVPSGGADDHRRARTGRDRHEQRDDHELRYRAQPPTPVPVPWWRRPGSATCSAPRPVARRSPGRTRCHPRPRRFRH